MLTVGHLSWQCSSSLGKKSRNGMELSNNRITHRARWVILIQSSPDGASSHSYADWAVTPGASIDESASRSNTSNLRVEAHCGALHAIDLDKVGLLTYLEPSGQHFEAYVVAEICGSRPLWEPL